MPCTVDFQYCNKEYTDGNCITCKAFVPGRGTKYYHCGNPEVQINGCSSSRKFCPECPFYIPDKTPVAYQTDAERNADWRYYNQEEYNALKRKQYARNPEGAKERVNKWRKENRDRYNAYMRELRRKGNK